MELHEKLLSSERAIQFSFFPFRDQTEEEVLLIGKEFDEKYHWHSLSSLSDNFDRTKQSFAGETPKAKRGNEHRKSYFILNKICRS